MSNILREKVVKTRKIHTCWGCWTQFPVGEQMHCQVVADGGEVATHYTCHHCQAWLDDNAQDWDAADWESLIGGSIGYWKDEVWHPQIG
jgi:hypothetical protein